MNTTFWRSTCALTLMIALPAAALAQRAGNANRPAAQAPRPAPVQRAASPVQRAASSVQRAAAPVPRATAPNPGGFNLNHDVTAPAQQRTAPLRGASPAYAHAPNGNAGGGSGTRRFHGPEIRNSRAPGGSYGWNHGVAWQPAPIYWGGGFWGSYALAALASSIAYGAYLDNQDQQAYPSFQVAPDSPGADLLQDYGLQQTPCGPPGLVVIWGPDNSVICAFPNDSVGPGNYQVDPATFTLVSASQ